MAFPLGLAHQIRYRLEVPGKHHGVPRLVSTVEEPLIDIGPKLFQAEGRVIQENICKPALTGLRPCTVLSRVVRRRYASSNTSSHDLARVHSLGSLVVSGDKCSTECVPRTFEYSAMTEGVIPIILMESRRNERLNPKIFICLIGKCVPVVAPETDSSMPECGISVRGLRNSSLCSDKNKRGIVEAVLQASRDFFFDGLPRQLGIGVHGTEVWHNSKNPL